MARKLDPTKIQVFGGPGQVFSRPGLGLVHAPWNQEFISPDEVLGPWDPFGGILRPMEAEGRIFGGPGAEPQENLSYFALFCGILLYFATYCAILTYFAMEMVAFCVALP